MRKVTMFVVLLFLFSTAPAFASLQATYHGYPTVKVAVNGQDVQGEVPAMVVEGRTLVPLRLISESLGCAVGFDPGSGTVTVSNPRVVSKEDGQKLKERWSKQLADFQTEELQIGLDATQGKISHEDAANKLWHLAWKYKQLLKEMESVTDGDHYFNYPTVAAWSVGYARAVTLAFFEYSQTQEDTLRNKETTLALGRAYHALTQYHDILGSTPR
ncbi:stalk domain-containing protein [Desulforudis sp. 1088]